MMHDPYTRQIWQQTGSAAVSAAVSCLVAAGSTALITDSDVTGAPTVAAVVTLWMVELVWSASYIRTAARRVSELREQQALHRHRRMRRRSREYIEPLPGVDTRTVARDARVIEERAAEPAAAEAPNQTPTLAYTTPFPATITGVRWGFDGSSPVVGPLPEPWTTPAAEPTPAVGGMR